MSASPNPLYRSLLKEHGILKLEKAYALVRRLVVHQCAQRYYTNNSISHNRGTTPVGAEIIPQVNSWNAVSC